jgi:hypothetical protein
MKFIKYENVQSFGADVHEILLENEVQNNLPISFIKSGQECDSSEWLLASIKDEAGGILLTAACTPPYKIVLYETKNKPNDAAVKLLSNEIKLMKNQIPGVLAEQGLARRFADVHAGNSERKMSMNVMQLSSLNDTEKAPGFCRELREDDMFYMPYWFKAFGDECNTIADSSVEYLKKRIGENAHYIWEKGHPVSCACNHRNTENGAGIGFVYTPPHYRGRGYASSVVTELSRSLLERGNKFCFLFADAENPVSCGIYRKLGFRDMCVFDEIEFKDGG